MSNCNVLYTAIGMKVRVASKFIKKALFPVPLRSSANYYAEGDEVS